MQTGARGTPGTGGLIRMNGSWGVAALSIFMTHVWDYSAPNGGPPAPPDSHSPENRTGAR